MAKARNLLIDRAPLKRGGNGAAPVAVDPRLLVIARAIGRLMAREVSNAAKIETKN
ncbi:MAG TPA: hypothetical protein VHX61_01320 [Rhizomicrobium sp.]|jgi:hypothetical protein|nr:hypothetical protein [Rhizomicrobium sp.]